MNLDDAQKQRVMKWVEEGLKISDIQNRLASELGLRLTYMEVRFLLDDLKLKPKDKEPPVAAPTTLGGAPAGPAPGSKQPPAEQEDEFAGEDAASPGGAGNVMVAVDQVTRPGALVSGKVTFSDGQKADWYLDQMGRLGVVAKQQGYKPSQADLMAFQTELQSELARQGY